jgi:hypothetical protein
MASVYPFQTCRECEAEAAGRCPRCHHLYCMQHFPRHAHATCARHLALHHDDYVCYVCGELTVPEQWSTAIFAHFIDNHACSGCGRLVCDKHTHHREEHVKISQDGMRSHRYSVVTRTCDMCTPLKNVGGIVGATWWVAGLITVFLTGWFLFHA